MINACFNPCKGFGVIGAEKSHRADARCSACFNPCKGFGVIGVDTHMRIAISD